MRAANGACGSSTRTARRRWKICWSRAIGEAGKRVHLGRSRNDQVLNALRLYLKDAVASSRQA